MSVKEFFESLRFLVGSKKSVYDFVARVGTKILKKITNIPPCFMLKMT